MEPKNINIEAAEFHNLVGVDGHPIKVRGSASIPMVTAETEFQQKLIFADGITTEGIKHMGMDFMKENKCALDIADKRISVNDGKSLSLVPSISISSDSSIHHVTLSTSITVPAASELEVMVQLSVKDGQRLIEGVHHDKVLVARAVVIPLDKCMPIRNANTSAVPVTLYRGMKVAMAEPVTEALMY